MPDPIDDLTPRPVDPKPDSAQPQPEQGLTDLRDLLIEDERNAGAMKKDSGLLGQVTGALRRFTGKLGDTKILTPLDELDTSREDEPAPIIETPREVSVVEPTPEVLSEISEESETGFEAWNRVDILTDEGSTVVDSLPNDAQGSLLPEPAAMATDDIRQSLDLHESERVSAPVKKNTTRSLRAIVTALLKPATEESEQPPEMIDETIEERLKRVQPFSTGWDETLEEAQDDAADQIPAAEAFEQTPAFLPDGELPDTAVGAHIPFVEDQALDLSKPEGESIDVLRSAAMGDVEKAWVGEGSSSPLPEPATPAPAADVNISQGWPDQIGEPSIITNGEPTSAPETESIFGAFEKETTNVEQLRSIALDGYDEEEFTPAVEKSQLDKPRGQFAQRIVAWWTRLSMPQRFIIISGASLVLVLIAAAVILAGTANRGAAPAATPIASDQPYPVGLELTGGWYFTLARSTIINGEWKPKGAEWLDGTQVRRVIAIPWSRQTEAFANSLIAGDRMRLYFNTNQILEYRVTSVGRVDRADTSVLDSKKAGLVLILYQEDSDKRWVVVAAP